MNKKGNIDFQAKSKRSYEDGYEKNIVGVPAPTTSHISPPTRSEPFPPSKHSTPSSLARMSESYSSNYSPSTIERLLPPPPPSKRRMGVKCRLARHNVDFEAVEKMNDFSTDENDIVFRTKSTKDQEEEDGIALKPNLQQRLEKGLTKMDIYQLQQAFEGIPAGLERLDPKELDAYIKTYDLEHEDRGMQTEPSPDGHNGLSKTSAHLEPSTLQACQPVLEATGIQNETSKLGEDVTAYFHGMRDLNELMINQLLDERQQLDRHLHDTRKQMLNRLSDLVKDMEASCAQQQAMLDIHYAKLILFIQESFIRKLAAENASILVPLHDIWVK